MFDNPKNPTVGSELQKGEGQVMQKVIAGHGAQQKNELKMSGQLPDLG
ncbi:MAG: hypothetical protein M3Q16_06245 [Pseudomonadota bacterium]|nr:hypothetical protein [Pseudomonadota bacterium]